MSVPAKKVIRLRDPEQIELQPLEADPRICRVRDKLAAIEKRREHAEKRRQVALARSRGQQPTRTLAERAAALLKGGQVLSLPPASEAEAAEEEIDILNRARLAKLEELERVRAEVSVEACERFAEAYTAALRQALDAATSLFRALEVNRVIRGRLIGAGYQVNETALPTHYFPAAAAVGDPDRAGQTPAAMFKAWLREKGIV